MARPPLVFTFYIAAPIDKVWNGFVSKEINQIIFMGADFEIDLRPGGAMAWSGPGKDGQRVRYVTGEVVSADAPTRLEYRFGMGDGAVKSRVVVTLTQESEAVKGPSSTTSSRTTIRRMSRTPMAGPGSYRA
jgi:uncharacterized protein YndB with AHSA1/START domain